MTVGQLASRADFTALNLSEEQLPLTGVYCCDLLSVVMSKATAGCVWVTVMGNINSIAVASLCEMACIVLAEGAQIEDSVLQKAKAQGINLLKSDRPVFETALSIYEAMKDA